ncbi:MAG: hypothetical protein ACKO2N_16575, partial [Tabrizicola sp.]
MLLSPLALIDTSLAIASITLFALGAVLTMRDVRHVLQGRILIALLLSVMCLAIAIAPGADLLPPSIRTIARALGIPNLGLLWWFCLAMLRDDFRIGPLEWAGL